MQLNQLKLRTRIFLGYLPPMILVMILGGFTLFEYFAIKQRRTELIAFRLAFIDMTETQLSLSGLLRGIRGKIIYPKDASYYGTYAEHLKEYQVNVAAIDSATKGFANRDQFSDYLTQAKEFVANAETVMATLKRGELKKPLNSMSN